MHITNYKKPTKQMYKFSHLKTSGFIKGYQIFDLEKLDRDKKPTQIIKVKLWHPGSVAYCAIWAGTDTDTLSTGSAGGGGYDKLSAALEIALINRGYELTNRMSGGAYIEELLYEYAQKITGSPAKKRFLVSEISGGS